MSNNFKCFNSIVLLKKFVMQSTKSFSITTFQADVTWGANKARRCNGILKIGLVLYVIKKLSVEIKISLTIIDPRFEDESSKFSQVGLVVKLKSFVEVIKIKTNFETHSVTNFQKSASY